MLIWPRSTFQSCGSSSRLVRRRKRPLRVIRGSFGSRPKGSSLSFSSRPSSTAFGTIVRNFSIENGFAPLPARRWRKITGRPDSSTIQSASPAKTRREQHQPEQ